MGCSTAPEPFSPFTSILSTTSQVLNTGAILQSMSGADDDGDGAASTAGSKQVKCSVVADNLVTIIFQNTDKSLFSGRLNLSNIHYRCNVGDVLEVLLRGAPRL